MKSVNSSLNPARPAVRVTTSWDDGHRLDLRVAALLEKYGLKGTFYVAPRDRHHPEGQRLSDPQIQELAQRHEIGAHTWSHVNLAHVTPEVALDEIQQSRSYLEALLGRPVTSFCYPYGAYTPLVREMVRRLGFRYARTVERFHYRAHDPFAAPTTVHTYDHWSDAYNILRFARFNVRTALRYRDWSELAIAMYDRCCALGGEFHLWGHSWELEQHGHWERLERVLAHIARSRERVDVQALTNGEMNEQQRQRPPRQKLLLTASYFPPKVGGLERYAHEIAKGAVQDGFDVVVVTSGERPWTEVEHTPDGLKVYRLGTHLKLSNSPIGLHWYWEMKKILLFERPDLINPHLPVPYLGDLAAWLAGQTPVVVTYHSGSMKKRNFVLDRITDAYELFILPLTLGRAQHIICSSDSVRDGFLKRFRRKSSTVTPGVDRQQFQPRAPRPAGREVLFIGNYSYTWKGLEYLRQAVALLPDVHLNVIGQGHPVAQERVTYLGVLHGQALVDAIQHADVLVLPSTSESESFGMVLVEAMACGVPVIGSRIGGIPYVIQDGQDGLLTRPRDPQDIARAIQQTLDDPAAADARAWHALHKVKTQFDWQAVIIPRYLHTLKAVLKGQEGLHATHVSAYYPPHLGGMELVAQSLAQALAVQGVGVQVVTSRLGAEGHGARAAGPATPRVEALPALEVAHTPLAPGLPLALWRTPAHTVYHLHAAQAYWPELTMLVAGLRRRPYVVHFHLDVEPSGPLGFLLGTYKGVFFRQVMRRAARVIVLQEDQRALVARKYGVDPARVLVVPNAVRPEFFLPAERPLPTGRPLRLLFVGRLTVQKRVDRLLELAALLGERVHLTIVGDGEDREKLSAQARALNLTNTHFAGVQRDAALLACYRQADVFVSASDREGMPLTLLEAMAAGLPVVASDVVGIHDLVQGVGVLVSPPTPAQFAQALGTLLDDPAQLRGLAQASRLKAGQHSWEGIAGDMIALYRELQTKPSPVNPGWPGGDR